MIKLITSNNVNKNSEECLSSLCNMALLAYFTVLGFTAAISDKGRVNTL